MICYARTPARFPPFGTALFSIVIHEQGRSSGPKCLMISNNTATNWSLPFGYAFGAASTGLLDANRTTSWTFPESYRIFLCEGATDRGLQKQCHVLIPGNLLTTTAYLLSSLPASDSEKGQFCNEGSHD